MIIVDKSFYESGCTMEGKGNRITLKGKDRKGNIDMIFVRDEVRVRASCGLLDEIIPFKYIEKICTTKEERTGETFPAIKLKD